MRFRPQSSCCCGILPFGDVAAAHSERHNHVMGRERGGQSSPDLFSADAVSPPRSRPPAEKPMAESAPQRHVLPKNLPNAVKHLNDDELETLHAATFDEMKRRGKLPPSGSGPLRRDTLTKRSPKEAKISHNRREDIAEASLPSGKVNAVRAAFKAGIRPATIARQFGISQANVKKALASYDPKR
jgi:hypothetical protein